MKFDHQPVIVGKHGEPFLGGFYGEAPSDVSDNLATDNWAASIEEIDDMAGAG